MTIPVLLLADNDLIAIEQQLQDKIAQAPEFFKHSSLLLDLQKLSEQALDIDVGELVALTRKLGFMPIGIRGGSEKQKRDSLALNLPVHGMHGSTKEFANKPEPQAKPVPEPEYHPVDAPILENKLITQPVRSGQRVYAKGDLIITATVSAGAEIMAEGNIHVYGSLRGRALAGVQGDASCRIFCSDLQAELISIAGVYRISDDLSPDLAQKPVQISLDNQTLIIKEL